MSASALSLEAGNIAVMDNLPAHKTAGVRGAIERAGASSCFCRPTAQTSIQLKTHSPN
ncbi:hypothetical protein BN77_p40089 [Rhizobium mesoamericanum STM3625]|uniref:Tc1-like transposase DDE domain-containing protein n=1 Tax=Rhizobium mesoamericanum STM3625 TaxID=1211777 RepID=K0PSM8_9HYPH|nr:hypothetical protein BN77_p40089 [Rhizobium mesoamericanum STM3625]